jgi:MFS_1, major facilitator family
MNMIVPSFFLFAVYAGITAWLPLFLRNMGYSVVHIGFLLAVFEVFGVIVPFFSGNIPAKNGKYGLFLFINGCVLALIPCVMFSLPLFALTALCLAVYASAIKAVIPVSDSFIGLQLGTKRDRYGRIRAVGSLGFVVANIVMQRFIHIDTISTFATVLWMTVPAVLFSLSLIVIPGIMAPLPPPSPNVTGTAPAESAQALQRSSDLTGNAPAESAVKAESAQAEFAPAAGTPTDRTEKPEKTELPEKPKIPRGFFGTIARTFSLFFGQFSPYYWLVLALIFLTMFGQAPTNHFFSMYVREYLHSDAAGFLWVLSALSEIPFMFFSNRFIRRYGSVKLLLFCSAASSVRNLVYVCFPSVAGAAAAQLFNSVTFGLFHPAAVMFAAQHARRKEQYVLSQLLYSICAIGTAKILASALGGIVVHRFGYGFLYASYSAFPLAGILLFAVLNKRTKHAE